MSIVPASTGAMDLPALANRIRAAHEACERDALSTVEHAIEAGTFLIEAKAQCTHGAWLPWLTENFEFNRFTAAGYMRIARKCAELHTFEPESINAALKEIAEPRAAADDFEDDKPADAEVIDGEPVLEGPSPAVSAENPVGPFSQSPSDGTASSGHIADEGAAGEPKRDITGGPLRTEIHSELLTWFSQGRVVMRLLDDGQTLQALSKQERAELTQDVDLMETVLALVRGGTK